MHVACKHVRADDVHDVGSREGGETDHLVTRLDGLPTDSAEHLRVT